MSHEEILCAVTQTDSGNLVRMGSLAAWDWKGQYSIRSLEQQDRQGGHWVLHSLPAQATAHEPMPGQASALPFQVWFCSSFLTGS